MEESPPFQISQEAVCKIIAGRDAVGKKVKLTFHVPMGVSLSSEFAIFFSGLCERKRRKNKKMLDIN